MYSLISKSGFSALDRWVEKRNQRKIQERAAKEKRDEQSQVCLSISSLSALRYSCLPWQGIFHPVTVVRKKKLVNVDLPPLFQAGQRDSEVGDGMGLNIDLVSYRPSLNRLSPDSGGFTPSFINRHEQSLSSNFSISTGQYSRLGFHHLLFLLSSKGGRRSGAVKQIRTQIGTS
ncbi:vascular endothelial growth factor receptor 2 [Striga asiatica]|uniref:Vascular endothelial growth factor receptor 2 n=1 Tax=Striga asiatica TaxID=4170 RepID=A0A5A7Q2R7_STRAF|nr:vascular endothelial growth factor receptor 2 [Striga asiatica]